MTYESSWSTATVRSASHPNRPTRSIVGMAHVGEMNRTSSVRWTRMTRYADIVLNRRRPSLCAERAAVEGPDFDGS